MTKIILTGIFLLFIFNSSYSASQKIQSTLEEIISEYKSRGIKYALSMCNERDIKVFSDNKIKVVLEVEENKNIDTSVILNCGGIVEASYDNLRRVLIPINRIEEIAEKLPEVKFIKLPLKPFPLITSEGVNLTNASQYHSSGYTGSGVKVAVIDAGFSGLSNAKANGELPSNVIAYDYTGTGIETGSNHGTGVAEIIYDMAPGVQLYLMKIDDSIDLGIAKNDCKALGVKVINHSMGWFNSGPGNGTGEICNIANDARANGIIWVNSAGNQANYHWEGPFNDYNSDNWHDFAAGDSSNTITVTSAHTVNVFLRWNDTWSRPNQDYDLYLFNSAGQQVAASTNRQNGTIQAPPPVESISYNASAGTYHVRIRKYNANGNQILELFTAQDQFKYIVSSGSIVEPADSTNVVTVGAIYHGNWSSGPQEPFSSQGPTNDGRIKPDISGPDGVSNYTYGNFYGTSASCPHVAGAVALLISKYSGYTPDQIEEKLKTDAIDLGLPGNDNIYGYGKLSLNLNPPYAINTLCDNMVNPQNITNYTPQFSWTFSDADPLDSQTAFQILVSESLSNLNSNIGEKWDSGKVISNLLYTTYSGTPLEATTYYWKVRLWDQSSTTGPYCTAQFFSIKDSSAPATVTTLSAYPGPGYDCVKLTWISPGDDGVKRSISGGKIRIDYSTGSTHVFNLSNYKIEIATSCNPGILNTYIISNLTGGVTYYFRLWIADEVLNWSDISNQATSWAKLNYPPSAPSGLLCNGMVNPVELKDFTPVLSWSFNDLNEGDFQTAYRILVADNPGDLGNDTGNIWDTDRVISSSTAVKYSGTTLLQGSTYYWKVRVWDSYNSSSPYSSQATFSMYINSPPSPPQNLKVEGEINPKNVISTSPLFSWDFVDTNSGDEQTYFQVIVSSDTETINQNIGSLWDSGKLQSSQTSVKYSGNNLSNSTTYYWKVRTWDLIGSTGPYSNPGSFVTVNNSRPDNPVSLRTNGIEEPRDLPTMTPVFSWVFIDSDTWDKQSACKILVADDISILNLDTGNIWDTGKVISTMTSLTYGGQGLSQGVTYYWKVKTWDIWDYESEYSNPASFTVLAVPILWISTTVVDLGYVPLGDKEFFTFKIKNNGGGLLTGTIRTDRNWIFPYPLSFSTNSLTVNVTVDNEKLSAEEGFQMGHVNINSNGGNASVLIKFIATCVLVRPNPYYPLKGNLIFYGSGVTPGKTVIKIWTISGEHVKTIGSYMSCGNEIFWDGKDERGIPVRTGIYIYTYESPEEKGTGKFTLISK